MIRLEEIRRIRECNCCYSTNNVVEIVFEYDGANQGSTVALCKNCRKELCDMIEKEDGEHSDS